MFLFVQIPFSKFFLAYKGRIQDKQEGCQLGRISTLGITIADGATGPFQLELDYIGILYDSTHPHTFEYEMYPVKMSAIYQTETNGLHFLNELKVMWKE